MTKKLILIVLGAVLVIATLIFWRFKGLKPDFNITTVQGLENIILKPTSSSTSVEIEDMANIAKPPIYSGRDPAEANPDPEVIKSFSDRQKKDVFADIKKYGDMAKNQPEYASAWLQIGLLKKVIGDYVGAKDAWSYVALIRPNEATSYKNLADLYWRYLSDYQKAEYNFKKAIANKPDDVSTYRDFSEFYASSGKDESTLDVLKQGVKDNPDDLNLIKSMASFYEDHKDYEQALEWWLKAKEQDPQNVGIRQTIEDLRKKLVR